MCSDEIKELFWGWEGMKYSSPQAEVGSGALGAQKCGQL